MAFSLAILFMVVLGTLFGAQFLLYVSLVRFFSILDVMSRCAVYIGTALIPLSFIVASVLASLKENVFTRYFYVISGAFLGIGVNFVLAAIGVWILIFFFRFTSVSMPVPLVATAFFIVALAVSGYGMWNTRHPVVRRIDVSIPNLPEWWQGKRIVQLSDIHLGYVYQPEFMRRVAEQVDALDPELVVITGDLFDGMDGELERSLESIDAIRAREGTLFVNGNHETYFGLEKTFGLLSKTKIRILRDEVIDIRGLKILGIGYPDRGEKKDVVEVARALSPSWIGRPNVLLYHSPSPSDGFRDLGVNVQLSGHTHKGQIFPFNLITKLVYRGRDYGLYTQGDYTLYTTNGIGTWGPSMRIGNRPEIVEITLRKK